MASIVHAVEQHCTVVFLKRQPIVWLSEREWQEWYSPWESNKRIPELQESKRLVYGVVWAFDHHAWYSLSFEEKYYEPEAYFHNEQHAYLIFDLSQETAE